MPNAGPIYSGGRYFFTVLCYSVRSNIARVITSLQFFSSEAAITLIQAVSPPLKNCKQILGTIKHTSSSQSTQLRYLSRYLKRPSGHERSCRYTTCLRWRLTVIMRGWIWTLLLQRLRSLPLQPTYD